jgi:hypothetical protein
VDLIAAWNLDEFAAEFVREVERYLAKWARSNSFARRRRPRERS